MFERRALVREFVPWNQDVSWSQSPPPGPTPYANRIWDLEDPYNPDPYK